MPFEAGAYRPKGAAVEVCDVLIVDDDPDIREVLSDLLTTEGFSVASASNGERALTWLKTSGRPNVILLDLMMPVMNGKTFRSEQLKDADIKHVPVVVMSASENLLGLNGEFEGLPRLPKPLEVDDLLDVIGRHCPRQD